MLCRLLNWTFVLTLFITTSVTYCDVDWSSCDDDWSAQGEDILCEIVLEDVSYCFRYIHTMSRFCCALCQAKAGELGWRQVGLYTSSNTSTTTIPTQTPETTITTTIAKSTETTETGHRTVTTETSTAAKATTSSARSMIQIRTTQIFASQPTPTTPGQSSLTFMQTTTRDGKDFHNITTPPLTALMTTKTAASNTESTILSTIEFTSQSQSPELKTTKVFPFSTIPTRHTTRRDSTMTTLRAVHNATNSETYTTPINNIQTSTKTDSTSTEEHFICRCKQSDYPIPPADCQVVKQDDCLELNLEHQCCYECVEKLLKQRACTAHCNDDPGHIEGGVFNRSITYKENDTAVFACYSQFHNLKHSLNPPTCKYHPWKGGIWLGDLPECQKNILKIALLSSGCGVLVTTAIVITTFVVCIRKKRNTLAKPSLDKKDRLAMGLATVQLSRIGSLESVVSRDGSASSDSCYYSKINEDEIDDSFSIQHPSNAVGFYATEVTEVGTPQTVI